MRTEPLISVIVPLYNKADYILYTVNSILNQTFNNFELIIVDDGSTDASLKKLESVKDPRVKILIQENAGVSAARNKGVEVSVGEWVAFLDADDYWDKDFLAKTVAMTEIYKDGEVFSTGRQLKFEDSFQEYDHHFLPLKGSSAAIDYLKVVEQFLPPINSSSCLIKRAILLKSKGFIRGMKNYEDHELWLRLSYDRPIYYLNEPLSIYRKDIELGNSGSRSSLKGSDFITFLKTLKLVKTKIKEPSRVKSLEVYAFRFSLYNYFLNAKYLNSVERKMIRTLLKEILNNRQYFILFVITGLKPAVLDMLICVYRKAK
jgi:glycosyltransferase involved in cell wall biosynthesis